MNIKNRRFIFIFATAMLIIILGGCENSNTKTNSTNESIQKYYGEILNFTFSSETLSNTDTVTVEPNNYNGTFYIYEYCDVPFTILKKKDNHHVHVYPFTDECITPTNKTINQLFDYDLENIKTRNKTLLEPGEYLFKVFYSTYAQGEYMREHNEKIIIK